MEKKEVNNKSFTNILKKKENNEILYSEFVQNEILEKYDIFSNVYTSSDDFNYVDSEEDISSKNLENSNQKNILSLAVHNIINIYPNNERNREFKKYKERKIEEKRQKELDEEREMNKKKKKIYEEKRKKKLEKYKIEKRKKKLIEKEKYNKENIEYNYLMVQNYFEFLMKNGKHRDIYFSFHDLYISPMRLYYFANINIDQIYYLDLSRKWLPDNYVSIILELCSCKKIKILNLSYNKLTYNSLKHFSNFLSENKTLFSLNLGNNDLTDNGKNFEGINNIFESIKNNKTLKILNLANTNMNQNNGDVLCQILKINNTLIEMNFENNNFSII
ncbi:conserved Plasmodium protein, unknown function [Plasmodium relictum]|uniref:Leucine-rich repeat protein n=1 Tax=Plasmodium relictum TaxID=85471 RepID=A0A1J1HDV3_PLARL|nr:conserved Plasmodium protein, unknown function [Plasmodium relictum]CRH04116.1 conserved Plasmodium protein, unknown function [Plasmodium relictum]